MEGLDFLMRAAHDTLDRIDIVEVQAKPWRLPHRRGCKSKDGLVCASYLGRYANKVGFQPLDQPLPRRSLLHVEASRCQVEFLGQSRYL
jgi:hypothetical protein